MKTVSKPTIAATIPIVNQEVRFIPSLIMPLSTSRNNAFSAHFTFLTISLRPLNHCPDTMGEYHNDDEHLQLETRNQACPTFVIRIRI